MHLALSCISFAISVGALIHNIRAYRETCRLLAAAKASQQAAEESLRRARESRGWPAAR